MTKDPRAGQPADSSLLVNIPRLITSYYSRKPDISDSTQRVVFGTSGHRGSSLHGSFNEDHILAITQAICWYRKEKNITGPLFLGMDTHALSEPAFASALEVLAANQVEVMIDQESGYTPTPALSHAILTYNRGRTGGLADGIVITPSHNPPEDGGFKYNPPSGGPADTNITGWIEKQANQYLADGLKDVRTISLSAARSHSHVQEFDFAKLYVDELASIIDLDSIRSAKIKGAVDPLGGAG